MFRSFTFFVRSIPKYLICFDSIITDFVFLISMSDCLLLVYRNIVDFSILTGASLIAQLVKNLPAVQETLVRFLGWEDPPEGGYGNGLQYSCLENPHGQRSLVG